MYSIAIQTGISDTIEAIQRLAPRLAALVAIILAGWLAARLLSWLTRKLLRSLVGRMQASTFFGRSLENSGADSTVPRVIGAIVFWLVLLIFVAAAMDTMGLPLIAESLNQLVFYLPNAVAAVLILLAGLIAGNALRGAVVRGSATAGITRPEAVGGFVRASVMVVAVVIALEQVGVSGHLLVVLVATVVGTLFAGAALAFGLGSRVTVGNIVSSYYVAQSYTVGQRIRISGFEGTIIRTTPTAVVLDVDSAQVHIPSSRFAEEPSTLLKDRA